MRLIDRLERFLLSMAAIPCALSAQELDELWARNAAGRLTAEPDVNASTGTCPVVEPEASCGKAVTLT